MPGAYFDLATLDWGSVAFSSPPEIRYDETRLIDVKVSPSYSVEELRAQIRGPSDGTRLRLAPSMGAKLVGGGFDIVSSTPERQVIAKGDTTTWQWAVTPKAGTYGTETVTLSLWAHVKVDGEPGEYTVRTFRRDIAIRITPLEFVGGFVRRNWQWLWGALLVPLVPLLWKVTRRPRPSLPEGY